MYRSSGNNPMFALQFRRNSGILKSRATMYRAAHVRGFVSNFCLPQFGWWPMLRKNLSFMVFKSIAIDFASAKQMRLEINGIIGDVKGSRNRKSIELSGSDDPTRVADYVIGVTPIRSCVLSNVVGIVSRSTAANQRSVFDVNKSIAISIIDRNIHR